MHSGAPVVQKKSETILFTKIHPRNMPGTRNKARWSPCRSSENRDISGQILIKTLLFPTRSEGESPTDHHDRSDSSTEPYPKVIRVKSEHGRTKTREVMYVQSARLKKCLGLHRMRPNHPLTSPNILYIGCEQLSHQTPWSIT